MSDRDIRDGMTAYVVRTKPCAFPPRIDLFQDLAHFPPRDARFSHAARIYYSAEQGYGGTRASCIVVRTHGGEYQEFTR